MNSDQVLLPDSAALRATELVNIRKKLDEGKALTAREGRLLDEFYASELGDNGGPSAVDGSDTAFLAKKFGCTTRTIQRIKECESLPGVPEVPWDDVAELCEWYRLHYRSDASMPATGNAKLPDWLKLAAGFSSLAPAGDSLPAEASGPVDVLEEMERVLGQKRARHLADTGNHAAESEYFAALNDFTESKKRILSGGADGYIQLSKVQATLDGIHSRLPGRVEKDLLAVFPEIQRAVSGPDPQQAFQKLISGVCDAIRARLVRSRFAAA